MRDAAIILTTCLSLPLACARAKNSLRLRTPITSRRRRRLRVCSVARYSTDEQRRQSISAQHRFNRNALEAAGVVEFEWDEVSDEGVSGELRDRPGTDRLRQGIASNEWDLIICEDSSRLYRNLIACLDLVGSAVDNNVRVICIGDDVDTAEDEWPDRLQVAQNHFCQDNKFTRHRIKRTFEDLWAMGAALGPLRPGYRRRPTLPDADYRLAEGPYYDEIAPELSPVVHEAFERIANGEPTWSVAQWLTEKGLPMLNGRQGTWRARNVMTLIKCESYRGEEFHGKTKSVKKFSTGRSKQERNDPEDVKRRQMPHHRIVPDQLWYRANEMIRSRTHGGHKARGEAHPLSGIPRDSRKPMSRIFVCGAGPCSAKMYAEGRNEGGYRCSGSAKGTCWNKATALRDLTHQRVSQAIAKALIPDPEQLQAFVAHCASLVRDENYWQSEEDRLAAKVREIRAKCVRLGKVLEGRDDPPETLVMQLDEREADLRLATAELEGWRERRQMRPVPPTTDTIVAAINSASRRLLDFDRDVCALLERLLVDKIRAVPYQLFQSKKVVLRAEFELNLVAILPAQMIAGLSGSEDWQPATWFPPKVVRVDLFKPSPVPANAVWAAELRPFFTLEGIAELLGITKRKAHLAAELGDQMREAGITDPYIRLTVPPAAASRWRIHAQFRNDSATDLVAGEGRNRTEDDASNAAVASEGPSQQSECQRATARFVPDCMPETGPPQAPVADLAS